MIQPILDPSIEFMRDLDRRFREASGLSDRRDYSIFYSRLQRARVMVIGIKPGGRRDGSHQLASQSFYEDWSHEYVDMDYRIAAVMRPALMHALGATSADELRGIPKTNCFFHRAVGTDDFSSAELREHAAQCAPFLAEMIGHVQPDVLILEGAGARDLIVRHQCRGSREMTEERVTGLRRGTMNTFFRHETAFLSVLGREVELLTLGHPSQFGHLPTWAAAVEKLRANLGPPFLTRGEAASSTSRPAGGPVTAIVPAAAGPLETGRPALSPGSGRPTKDRRLFRAAMRPPESFRYSPIHDFWQELQKTGEITADGFFEHLQGVGWRRPSGKPLTPHIVRTDLVSMVKHGFATVANAR